MSSIVTEQGILHYESIGRGQPVILLHGWINSWDVWRDSMLSLVKTGRYRVYALDFWGFGDSAKQATSQSFQIDGYVEMVYQFIEKLGIVQAPICGHSMGGTVALHFALKYPNRVKKVAVVGSPIVGSSLNFFLKLAGYGWIAELVWRYPFLLQSIMQILLAGDSQQVKQMISRDVKRTSIESFFRSIGDLYTTDLRQDIANFHVPLLGIYGRRDNIVSPNNGHLITQHFASAQIAWMENSRHFPMIDESERFVAVLAEFLKNDPQIVKKVLDSTNLEPKFDANGKN